MAIKCYTCGEEITFSKKYLSKSGKQIPLWADMLNTHGHDENGNPTRQPLPPSNPVPQKEWQQYSEEPLKTRELKTQDAVSVSGITSDLTIIMQQNLIQTKAVLAQLDRIEGSLTETKNRILALTEKLEYNTQVDTKKLVGQIQTISDTIAPFLKADLKTASQIYEEGEQKIIERPKEYSTADNEDPASQLGA